MVKKGIYLLLIAIIAINNGIYGNRFFSDNGRFTQVDPMWQKYADTSPYVRVANNPLVLVDPNGKQAFIAGYEGRVGGGLTGAVSLGVVLSKEGITPVAMGSTGLLGGFAGTGSVFGTLYPTATLNNLKNNQTHELGVMLGELAVAGAELSLIGTQNGTKAGGTLSIGAGGLGLGVGGYAQETKSLYGGTISWKDIGQIMVSSQPLAFKIQELANLITINRPEESSEDTENNNEDDNSDK